MRRVLLGLTAASFPTRVLTRTFALTIALTISLALGLSGCGYNTFQTTTVQHYSNYTIFYQALPSSTNV